MDYDKLSRDELVRALRELLQTQAQVAEHGTAQQRLVHELQVHQIELGMQNRELREAQGELEASRNRYAELYDFAPVAYCTLDSHGLVEELNLTGASMFGCERARALGQPFVRLVQLEEPQKLWQHLGRCAVLKEPVISEFRMLLRDRKIDVQAVSVPVMELNKTPRAFRTAFTDITLRKRAEQERAAAHASEQRLRALLEALDHAHVEAAAELASSRPGLSGVMAVIVRQALLVTEARWARLDLALEAGQFGPIHSGCAEEGERDPSAGPELQVELSHAGRMLAHLRVGRAATDEAFSDQARGMLQMLVERLASSLAIARLHMLEARETWRLSLLERVARRLRSIEEVGAVEAAVADIASEVVPDFSDVCVVHLISGGRLTLRNVGHADVQRGEALASALRDPETARSLTECLEQVANAREPRLMPLSGKAAAGAAAVRLDDLARTLQTTSLIVCPLIARDRVLGTMCFGRLGASEVYDGRLLAWAQEIAGRCASALDATWLVRELREALQWRENLMAMISHDLKNPLSAISLSAQSLTPEIPGIERRRSHKQVDLIRRSADHMHHMINDLLSASMLENGSFRVEPSDESAQALIEEAGQMAEPLMAARHLKLERDFARDLPSVRADRESILRVFSNLLGNAAKFTPPGGTVCLSASPGAERVLFSVSDTGPGIPEEQRSRMFERYWKGRKSGIGLGLGLYIAKAIVEAHGGRIWIEGGSASGTKACFELPCYRII